MNYIKCKEEEATHVRISNSKFNNNHISSLKVTTGEVYKIERNTTRGYEGEEMIKNNEGMYIFSFSIGLEVEWLKETH